MIQSSVHVIVQYEQKRYLTGRGIYLPTEEKIKNYTNLYLRFKAKGTSKMLNALNV